MNTFFWLLSWRGVNLKKWHVSRGKGCMYIKDWLKSVHKLCSINHINLASKYNYSSDCTLWLYILQTAAYRVLLSSGSSTSATGRHDSDIKRVVTLNMDTVKELCTIWKLLTVNTPKAYLILFSLVSIQWYVCHIQKLHPVYSLLSSISKCCAAKWSYAFTPENEEMDSVSADKEPQRS
jgi:hypothetical protein